MNWAEMKRSSGPPTAATLALWKKGERAAAKARAARAKAAKKSSTIEGEARVKAPPTTRAPPASTATSVKVKAWVSAREA